MKLVEILARELVEWPEGAISIAQDNDGRTYAYAGTPDRSTGGEQWLTFEGPKEIALIVSIDCDRAIDRAFAVVTRDQWQSQRDRVAANDDPTADPVTVEYQSTDGPLDWRDRIREIDAQQVHLADERAELVAKLAGEGFVLCASVSAEVAEPVNMADQSNWQVGDLFTVVGNDSHNFDIGETVRLTVLEDDRGDGHRYEHMDKRDFWWVEHANVRFHSRP